MKEKKILIASIILFIIAIIFFVCAMKMTKVNEEDNIDTTNDFLSEQEEVTQDDDSDFELNENMKVTMEAVILQVNSSSLRVMSIGEESLYDVITKKLDDSDFKKGQEILIYYDGIVATIYPGLISNVGKIEIIKEETDIAIPEKFLEYYNIPTNKMSVSLSKLTKTGISFVVDSAVELPSDNFESYSISKNGTLSSEVAYSSKLQQISDTPIEDTISKTDLESEGTSKLIQYDIDWTSTYGELEKLDERKL